jgi:hypothetical protein
MFVVLERPCMDRSWPQKLAATLSKASFSFTAALRARRL